MEKCIFHIELMDGPLAGQSKGEHCTDGGGLHNWAECLIKVHTRSLCEAAKDPACLVPLKRAISLQLVLEDPLAGDDISPRGARNEVPSVVLQERPMFFFHSSPPIGVSKGDAEGLRNR